MSLFKLDEYDQCPPSKFLESYFIDIHIRDINQTPILEDDGSPLIIRLSKKEFLVLEQNANENGKSPSEYLEFILGEAKKRAEQNER